MQATAESLKLIQWGSEHWCKDEAGRCRRDREHKSQALEEQQGQKRSASDDGDNAHGPRAGPGDRAPAALRDREVTYWSRDRATLSASRAEGEAVRGLPGPARALLGQIQRDLDADGGGGDQREICIRPTHSSWVAGARAGQRELYVHIPHADSLVEASGLVAQALAQEGLAAASI